MINSFFTKLAAMLLPRHDDSPTPSKAKFRHTVQQLTQRPDLQRHAKRAGDNRHLAQHRRTCTDGYLAKMALVRAGKGRNSTAGIPQWFRDQHLTNKEG